MDKKSNYTGYIISLILGIIVGLIPWLLHKCNPAPPIEPIIIRDTVSVIDTVRIEQHTKPITVIRHDTILKEIVKDSVTVDTIAVDIPIIQSLYKDTFATDSSSIEVGVKFSGYNAKIDSVGINYQCLISPPIVEKKQGFGQFFGIGIGVGYGASVVGQTVYAAPEIGVHITYGWGYSWRK